MLSTQKKHIGHKCYIKWAKLPKMAFKSKLIIKQNIIIILLLYIIYNIIIKLIIIKQNK